MKKFCAIVLTLSIALALMACASKDIPSTYSVTIEYTTYTVDTVNGTISDGTHSYSYGLTGTSDEYSVDIIYPDKCTYFWNEEPGGGSGGWYNAEYADEQYADPDILCQVIDRQFDTVNDTGFSGSIIVCILFIIIGLLSTIFPHLMWYCSQGWKFKNAEPSDSILIFYRALGIIMLIIALIILFI